MAGLPARHLGPRCGHRLVPSGLGVGDASGSLIESAAVVAGAARHAANRCVELAGVGVSVAFGAKAGEAGDGAGEWDPWDIERGER